MFAKFRINEIWVALGSGDHKKIFTNKNTFQKVEFRTQHTPPFAGVFFLVTLLHKTKSKLNLDKFHNELMKFDK